MLAYVFKKLVLAYCLSRMALLKAPDCDFAGTLSQWEVNIIRKVVLVYYSPMYNES